MDSTTTTATATTRAVVSAIARVVIKERFTAIITIVGTPTKATIAISRILYAIVAIIYIIGIRATLAIETIIVVAMLAPCAIANKVAVILGHGILAPVAHATAILAVVAYAIVARYNLATIITDYNTILTIDMLVDIKVGIAVYFACTIIASY